MKKPKMKYLLRLLPKGKRAALIRYLRGQKMASFFSFEYIDTDYFLNKNYKEVLRLILKGYQVYLIMWITTETGCLWGDRPIYFRLRISEREEGKKLKLEAIIDTRF